MGDFGSYTWGEESPSAPPATIPNYTTEDNPFASDSNYTYTETVVDDSSGTANNPFGNTSTAPPAYNSAALSNNNNNNNNSSSNNNGSNNMGSASYSSGNMYTSGGSDAPIPQLPPRASKFVNDKLNVTITNPEKHGEGNVDAYVSYEVISKSSLPGFVSEGSVRRRFQDFVWLKNELDREFPSHIVPPMPEKQRLDYLDRFSPIFIEKRQAALQRFVNRIVGHPVLHTSETFKQFIELKPAAFETLKQTKKSKGLDGLTDTLMNSFSKVKFPDPKFVEIAEYNATLEENLTNVEKIHQRICKRQTDLCEDLANFGGVLNLLSTEETVGKAFHKFGQVHDKTAISLKEMSDMIEFDFLSQVHDYLLYNESTKIALKQRENQQIEYEELTGALETKLAEREAVMHPDQANAANKFLNTIKGNTDPAKIQEQIDELQRAVDESGENNKRVANEMLLELNHFNHQKTADFKIIFKEYALAQQRFAQKMLDQWMELLPLIEEVKVE